MMINHNIAQKGGFALLLTLIIASVALAIGLSMLDITMKQLNLSTTARESEIAFQVAATAMNCLQYARNSNLDRSQDDGGSPFDIKCMDVNLTFSDSDSDTEVIHYYNNDGNNIEVAGDQRCVQFDMYVLLATSNDVSTTNSAGDPIQCDGDDGANVCTYAYARGHNRSCADVAAGSTFVVQRELTAEF